MKKIFSVDKKNVNKRLDKFLKTKLKTISRSQIKKMIEQGDILVDEKTAKVHHFLKENQIVKVVYSTKQEIKKTNKAKIKILSKKLVPEIIFENENFIIINKPAGLLVHPTEKNEPYTLASWLVERQPKIKDIGGQKYRGGIIHRLDKDVSGIMVAAKNEKSYHHLKKQFKKRTVQKKYIAIVYGRLEKSDGKINLPIGRSKNGKFVAHPKFGKEKFQESDKSAYTLYSVLEYIKEFSLLEVRILTGRTHQIRAHLSAIGHPILGDQIYKPKNRFLKLFSKRIKVIDLDRIMLHSKKIGFKDLNNKWVEFESPLPQKITEFINEKKST